MSEKPKDPEPPAAASEHSTDNASKEPRTLPHQNPPKDAPSAAKSVPPPTRPQNDEKKTAKQKIGTGTLIIIGLFLFGMGVGIAVALDRQHKAEEKAKAKAQLERLQRERTSTE